MSDGSTFTCGTHRAFIVTRGGETIVAELRPLISVQWQRIRDEISAANVLVPTSECCDLLEEVRSVLHELHIYRNGVKVWEGPIVRIEYEFHQVQLFAEDVLWQTKRTVLMNGYSNAHPDVGNALDQVDWLFRDQTYNRWGDPWNVVPHLHPLYNPAGGEPKTSRTVKRYQMYVFEDLDSYAAQGGIDYTCVNRDIYYNDVHLAWKQIQPITEDHISEWPRLVEYGNQLATRGIVTDGNGYGVVVEGEEPEVGQDMYGYVDHLISLVDDDAESTPDPPSAAKLLSWGTQATRAIDNRSPPPLGVIVPANSTLMPDAPWVIEDLVPGSWFKMTITRMCRRFSEWHKLQEVMVNESAPEGETVQISSTAAPRTRINPA